MRKQISRLVFSATLSLGLVSQLPAQLAAAPVEYVNWFALNSTAKFHQYFGLTADVQFRFVNDYHGQQHLVRIGPEVSITQHFSVVPAGYAYVWNYAYEQNPEPFTENEHRIWEQLMYKHKMGRFRFNHRLRLEQRFIESIYLDTVSQSYVNEGYVEYRNRIRYRFLMNVALNKPAMESKAVFVQLWDEYFLTFADHVDLHKNHQNRLFAGVGYQVTPSLSFNGGFFYQLLMKRNGGLVEHNMGPLISLTWNPDLTTFRTKQEIGS